MKPPLRRLGLIGAGGIGGPVFAASQAGQLPGWEVCGVLVRRVDAQRDHLFTTELGVFLATRPDLIVEVAGPMALAAMGEQLLRRAETWTVSAAALVDEALVQRLEAVGRECGHRLRILPGALAGLDGVAAAAAAPGTKLQLDIELLPGPGMAELRFGGSVREAARRFPNAVNIAVAAALAGPGLDATRVDVRHPGPVARHRLMVHAESAAGTLKVEVQPELRQAVHPVACGVIAALRREMQVIWVG